MNRTLGIILLVAGVILFFYGLQAQDSVASELSEAVTGRPTDKTIWFLIGGAALAIIGAFQVFRGRVR